MHWAAFPSSASCFCTPMCCVMHTFSGMCFLLLLPVAQRQFDVSATYTHVSSGMYCLVGLLVVFQAAAAIYRGNHQEGRGVQEVSAFVMLCSSGFFLVFH